MIKAVIQLMFVAAIAVSSGAWGATDTKLRCGLSLGASDQEQDEQAESKKNFGHSTRSLAGPRLEKVQQFTEAESFQVLSTDQLLPETLTYANFGCTWRF